MQGEGQDEVRLDDEMDRVVWSEGGPPPRLQGTSDPVRDTGAPPPPYAQGMESKLLSLRLCLKHPTSGFFFL